MSPAVTDARRRLTELRSARDAVTTNLLDLEADGTYSLLKAGDGLSGATAVKARPALERVDELWRGLQLLDALIDEADLVRGTGKLDDRRAERLLELLDGESIALPAESVPLAKRSLTGAPVVGKSVTPGELLTGMEEAFAALRDVVAEVEAVWQDLVPRVERAIGDGQRLDAALPGHRGLAAVRTSLQTLADKVTDDPIGAADDMAEAEATLAALDQVVKQRAALEQQLANELRVGAQDVAGLAELIEAGRTALAQSRAEVVRPAGLYDPLDPTILSGERGLEPWLVRLQALHAVGEVDKASIGFRRWRTLADQTLATARTIADANARPSRRRRELRGLMRAAQAKAGGVGRAEDPSLTELARRARTALNVPCDLPAAEAAVEAYLTELRRSGGRTP